MLNRREFITAAIGAAIVSPVLPVVEYTTFLLPEGAVVYGMSPIEMAWKDINLAMEWQGYLIRTMACAFNVPEKFLRTKEM